MTSVHTTCLFAEKNLIENGYGNMHTDCKQYTDLPFGERGNIKKYNEVNLMIVQKRLMTQLMKY